MSWSSSSLPNEINWGCAIPRLPSPRMTVNTICFGFISIDCRRRFLSMFLFLSLSDPMLNVTVPNKQMMSHSPVGTPVCVCVGGHGHRRRESSRMSTASYWVEYPLSRSQVNRLHLPDPISSSDFLPKSGMECRTENLLSLFSLLYPVYSAEG